MIGGFLVGHGIGCRPIAHIHGKRRRSLSRQANTMPYRQKPPRRYDCNHMLYKGDIFPHAGGTVFIHVIQHLISYVILQLCFFSKCALRGKEEWQWSYKVDGLGTLALAGQNGWLKGFSKIVCDVRQLRPRLPPIGKKA